MSNNIRQAPSTVINTKGDSVSSSASASKGKLYVPSPMLALVQLMIALQKCGTDLLDSMTKQSLNFHDAMKDYILPGLNTALVSQGESDAAISLASGIAAGAGAAVSIGLTGGQAVAAIRSNFVNKGMQENLAKISSDRSQLNKLEQPDLQLAGSQTAKKGGAVESDPLAERDPLGDQEAGLVAAEERAAEINAPKAAAVKEQNAAEINNPKTAEVKKQEAAEVEKSKADSVEKEGVAEKSAKRKRDGEISADEFEKAATDKTLKEDLHDRLNKAEKKQKVDLKQHNQNTDRFISGMSHLAQAAGQSGSVGQVIGAPLQEDKAKANATAEMNKNVEGTLTSQSGENDQARGRVKDDLLSMPEKIAQALAAAQRA